MGTTILVLGGAKFLRRPPSVVEGDREEGGVALGHFKQYVWSMCPTAHQGSRVSGNGHKSQRDSAVYARGLASWG